QLEVRQGRPLPYDRMVSELLGVELEVPDPTEVAALRAEVEELAGGHVETWEAQRLVSGEAKWDVAIETYMRGRRYAFGGGFPLEIHEHLELIRITEELWSVNLSWYPPSRMTCEINVATPRTPNTVAFEVAHNIY